MSDVTTVNCPTCNKPVIWGEQSPYRPFCSKRCADVDLQRWLTGRYAIPSTGDEAEGDGSEED